MTKHTTESVKAAISVISSTPGATAGVLEFCGRAVLGGEDFRCDAYVTFLPSHDAPAVPRGMRGVRLTVRGQLSDGCDPSVRHSLADSVSDRGQSVRFSAESGRYEIRKNWTIVE